jgi:MFS family permease
VCWFADLLSSFKLTTPGTLMRFPAVTTFQVFRNRNFRLFFVVQTVSAIGTWMQLTALGWLVYRLSGSAYLVATLAFLSQFPVLLLAPWAGVLADRFDRCTLLIFTQSASLIITLTLAILVLRNDATMFRLLALVTAGAIVYALDLPARQSFLNDLVGTVQVRDAIVMNSLSFHFARMAGALIAGILISRVNEGWCILLNAFSFLAVALALMAIARDSHPNSQAKLQSSGMLAGFHYVREHPDLGRVLLLLSIVSLMGAQHSTFIPVLVKQNLHRGARVLGLLMGGPGLGALTASLFLLLRSSKARLSLLPAMPVGAGIALAMVSWSSHVWLVEMLLIVLGFCITFQNAASNILLQESAPPCVRGRIMALFSMAFMGLMPLGAIIVGFAATIASVSLVLTMAGTICAISSLIVEYGFRARRLAGAVP